MLFILYHPLELILVFIGILSFCSGQDQSYYTFLFLIFFMCSKCCLYMAADINFFFSFLCAGRSNCHIEARSIIKIITYQDTSLFLLSRRWCNKKIFKLISALAVVGEARHEVIIQNWLARVCKAMLTWTATVH